MKTLIIYYSYEGNTEFLARSMASALGADLLALKPQKEEKKTGFSKYLWGGRQVFSKARPDLAPWTVDPFLYDFILIGSPVWAWNYAPALESFFSKVALKEKKIAVFCCHGGGPGRTLEKMKTRLEGNTIVGQKDFMNPLKIRRADQEKKAVEWAREAMAAAQRS